MKVAIIASPLIPVPPALYGGIERIVYMLIQELQKKGHDITLYANENSEPNCRLIGYRESKRYGLADIIKINRITGSFALQGYDVVHTFGRMSNIAMLMLCDIPKIVSYQLPPTLSQVSKAVKIARKDTLYFTACSNYIADQISPFTTVTTIYNGVDVKEYEFSYSVPDDAPLVFLGRIQEEKGTAIAIQVAKRSNRRLIIAGNIPDEYLHQQYFEREVKPHIDQEQIKYIGPVNNEEKNELLGNAAALLMPVTWGEPFGIVMAEALACGTPVIGFAKGAIPEVIENGVNGFVCETTDEMVDAVKKLPMIDRLTCRQVAEDKFSAAVIAGQYEDLYLSTIDKK